MLHFIIENGHAHLMKQFSYWINRTMKDLLKSLQNNLHLANCLEVFHTNKLRQVLN